GAQAALVVNPYYNKPTQEGLYRHFRAVAESTSLPVFVYNIQSRTAVNVETATLERLVRDCRNIVGVKEASGSLDQMSQVIAACGPDFIVLSGDDNITLPLMAVGGRGVISVIANIVPRDTADLVHAALDGDFKRARELHYKLYPLARAAFLETNPIPIKEAMAMAGTLEPEFRLPMCRMTDANRERPRAVPNPYGLVTWPRPRARGHRHHRVLATSARRDPRPQQQGRDPPFPEHVGRGDARAPSARHDGQGARRRLRRRDHRDPPPRQERRAERHRGPHGRGGGRSARPRSRGLRGVRPPGIARRAHAPGARGLLA